MILVYRYRWNLKSLYENQESFYYDLTLIRDKIKKLSENREFKIDGKTLYALMHECFNIREMNSKTLLYASLNYYLNVEDDQFIKMKERAEEVDSLVGDETNFIDELINLIDEEKLKQFYNDEKFLKEYAFYIDNVRRMGKHLFVNDLINDNILKINKNLVEYNNSIRNMNFGRVDESDLNNSNINQFLISSDRKVRKDTFSKLNSSYLKMGNDYFNLLMKIVDSRKIMAQEKKYASVLECELDKDGLKNIIIDNLIKSVHSNIDLVNHYLEMKMRYLKIKNPHLYDINMSISDINHEYELDDSIDILKKVFKIFGDDYIKKMDYLLTNDHLDLLTDDKKHQVITFSWNNYVFMNYRNRYIDLKNLAHELGHVINYSFSLDRQPFIYVDSTVFTGEVASLVNEVLLNDYLYNNSSNSSDKLFYLSKLIENFISQVFRQTLYTEFENVLYNSSQLDLELINDTYLNLIKKYYGGVICIDDDIRCEWMRVGHLFRWSYYVYKYAFSYIMAFAIVKKIKEENIVDEYLDFLSSGCSMSNEELLKKLGIDIYDINLIDNSFNLLNDYISELEKMMRY